MKNFTYTTTLFHACEKKNSHAREFHMQGKIVSHVWKKLYMYSIAKFQDNFHMHSENFTCMWISDLIFPTWFLFFTCFSPTLHMIFTHILLIVNVCVPAFGSTVGKSCQRVEKHFWSILKHLLNMVYVFTMDWVTLQMRLKPLSMHCNALSTHLKCIESALQHYFVKPGFPK